jgi:hypothetical protein
VAYIEQLKKDFIEHVDGTAVNPDGTTKSVAQLNAKDNKSDANNFMINKGHAKELKDKLESYRNKLLSFVDKEEIETMSQTIGLDVHAKFRNANGST